MKFLDRRRRLILALLVASLLLNVAMLGLPGQLRGAPADLPQAGPGSSCPNVGPSSRRRWKPAIRKLPNTAAEVVFAGDSLVADGPWAEFYTEIHNRGIGGERPSRASSSRLDEITEGSPRKLFLLVGANDLAAGGSRRPVSPPLPGPS